MQCNQLCWLTVKKNPPTFETNKNKTYLSSGRLVAKDRGFEVFHGSSVFSLENTAYKESVCSELFWDAFST